MAKIITWVDLQGRYRVTSPAYTDPTRPAGETEDECLSWTWAMLVAKGPYGITADHPHFIVEDADQRARLAECCGTYFRYGGMPQPNREGRIDKATGKVKLTRDARDGAWEMDTDGRPKVNRAKAEAIQMDFIRVARNMKLVKLDSLQIQAAGQADDVGRARIEQEKQILRDIPQTFNLSASRTLAALKASWPAELLAQE